MNSPPIRWEHPAALHSERTDERPFPRREDPRFGWAATDKRLDAWRKALAQWVGQRLSRKAAIKSGNALLDFVSERPQERASPEVLCRRDGALLTSFNAWVSGTPKDRKEIVNLAHEFFDWYLDTHLSASDDHGRLIRSPSHFNPIARRVVPASDAETSRDPLPTRYLRELRQILLANDWEWAKKQKVDWVESLDTHTGERVRTWCPVRASAIALKLLLPLRTFQVRMVDSGEGDSLVHSDAGWASNTGRHAPAGKRDVRRGFLRRFVDTAMGAEVTGFFVNTNKTADHRAGEADHGYEIPWEQREAITIVDALAAWQARFNAVDGPLAWHDVADPEVRLSGTQRCGSAYFLMRLPRKHDSRQPVSDGALNRFWISLLIELENRVAARGQTRPDGSRIRFVTAAEAEKQSTPLFGLHSLRVSLLTALATEGAVPLHILSKVVAGHASVVMTLYYVKTNPADLSRCLTEASQKIEAGEQADFIRYLASEQRKEEGVVSNDSAGVAALSRTDAGLWKTVSTGVCPVGGTRCGDGGPRLSGNRHAPVPGGASNCVSCRFHVTGPAFLPGLLARFNAASLSMEGARREHRAAEAALATAEDNRFDREQEGKEGDLLELARANSRLEAAETRLAAAVTVMQASYELSERCKTVAHTHRGGLNLVLAGSMPDLEIAVRETSQVELWDAVCQSAHVHPCPEVSEAALRRAQAIDRLLMRHGAPPLLMNLPDDIALAAGNEMMRWMSQQVGRDTALTLLDGQAVGSTDVEQLVSDMVEHLAHDAAAAPSLQLEHAQ